MSSDDVFDWYEILDYISDEDADGAYLEEYGHPELPLPIPKVVEEIIFCPRVEMIDELIIPIATSAVVVSYEAKWGSVLDEWGDRCEDRFILRIKFEYQSGILQKAKVRKTNNDKR